MVLISVLNIGKNLVSLIISMTLSSFFITLICYYKKNLLNKYERIAR